jgi:hypothetical protein
VEPISAQVEEKVKSSRNSQTFKCHICGKSSTRAHDLKRHIQKVHLKCTDCSSSFQSRPEVLQHILECSQAFRYKKSKQNSSSTLVDNESSFNKNSSSEKSGLSSDETENSIEMEEDSVAEKSQVEPSENMDEDKNDVSEKMKAESFEQEDANEENISVLEKSQVKLSQQKDDVSEDKNSVLENIQTESLQQIQDVTQHKNFAIEETKFEDLKQIELNKLKKWKCQQCVESYPTAFSLKKHVSAIHSKSSTTCLSCAK